MISPAIFSPPAKYPQGGHPNIKMEEKSMEYTARQGTTALGIIGTALGGLAVAGGPILAGLNGRGAVAAAEAGCSDNHLVNRYEAAQAARIAELETEVKLRDANAYTDQKILQTYQYVDGRMRDLEADLSAQKVINQRTQDSFALAQADLSAVKAELKNDVKLEAERRCCGDNSIVTYANATFYPKMVADITTGTGTTAQSTYNPIPSCGCCCKS
nr:MAG TPA: hypothetical protein [Caudoviricetes sp.]